MAHLCNILISFFLLKRPSRTTASVATRIEIRPVRYQVLRKNVTCWMEGFRIVTMLFKNVPNVQTQRDSKFLQFLEMVNV